MTAGELRERVWGDLMRHHAAAYPLPAHGHNPNFRGAGEAAARLAEALLAPGARAPRLRPGDAVLAAPDYVLKPLRRALLDLGVHLWVPARYGDGYRLLRAGAVPSARAASIAGAERHGEPQPALPDPAALRCCLVACVVVHPGGGYLTKGYGFRPPDAAAALPRAALVHPRMIHPERFEPEGRLQLYATPDEVHRPPG